MQTSALNLHQKTAGGLFDPSPPQQVQSEMQTSALNLHQKTAGGLFDPSPPQQVQSEMQTSALNLHKKTAGGYIRPFAATTGTIRDADLRPQPSPEDGWRLHSALRRHNRYNQRCRPPPSTFTRRRRAATFDPSPPQQVQFTGCCRDDPDPVLFKTAGQYCGDHEWYLQVSDRFFIPNSSRILP